MLLCLLGAAKLATGSDAQPVLRVLERRESGKVRGIITCCVAGVCADKFVSCSPVPWQHQVLGSTADLLTLFPVSAWQQSGVESAHKVATSSATLQHKANSSSVPVPFYFTYPADFAAGAAHPPRQPLVFLMNGFSVEASRYSGVLAGLAARGFVVAASDYYHKWTEPPFPPFPREPRPPSLLSHRPASAHLGGAQPPSISATTGLSHHSWVVVNNTSLFRDLAGSNFETQHAPHVSRDTGLMCA